MEEFAFDFRLAVAQVAFGERAYSFEDFFFVDSYDLGSWVRVIQGFFNAVVVRGRDIQTKGDVWVFSEDLKSEKDFFAEDDFAETIELLKDVPGG